MDKDGIVQFTNPISGETLRHVPRPGGGADLYVGNSPASVQRGSESHSHMHAVFTPNRGVDYHRDIGGIVRADRHTPYGTN